MAALAVASGALRFGDFTLKSGARSSFFFNFGAMHRGSDFAALGRLFGQAVLSGWPDAARPQVLFGPAYKGIPLAVAAGVWLRQNGGWDPHICHDRKEAKDHGEGGVLVGAPLQGRRVLVLDDVLSRGTAARVAIQRVRDSGGEPVGLLVALDRSPGLAQSLQDELGVPIRSLLRLEGLLEWLDGQPDQDLRASAGRIREELAQA